MAAKVFFMGTGEGRDPIPNRPLPWLGLAYAEAEMAVLPTVSDAPERERFEISLDGEVVGFTTYHRTPRALSLNHTEIDPGHEGEGLASRLISAALDAARAEDLAVLPFCPFVRRFIEAHEEYLDLVPTDRRAEFKLD
jgi:uncharacterized protein